MSISTNNNNKRTYEEMQGELTKLEEKRKRLNTEIHGLERDMAKRKADARKERSIQVPWELFRKAAMEYTKAWKNVHLCEEDREDACQGCDDSDDEDSMGGGIKSMQWGYRKFYELRPLSGCPVLTVCSWCLKKCGPENALDNRKHDALVRVDPSEYNDKWQAKFRVATGQGGEGEEEGKKKKESE